MSQTATLWLVWVGSMLAGASVLIGGMFFGGQIRADMLIGKTTGGHHQIELACNACHTKPFGGGEVLQEACVGCHAAELKEAKDSHPAKKFNDPRNADRLEKLDALSCVTCHKEHKPEITGAMGLTLPSDYCALCHQDIGKDRASHSGLAFTTCASAGCHRYHDNRALYQDFLIKHAEEPETIVKPLVKTRLEDNEPRADAKPPLVREAANAPTGKLAIGHALDDWLAGAHAKAGVNCSDCHAPRADNSVWVDKPGIDSCRGCHSPEAQTFTQGKHGMRLAPGMKVEEHGLWGIFKEKPLTPMRPELAVLPMSEKAFGHEIGCSTCHSAHRDNVNNAQVESCLGCHTDQHSKNYKESPHYKLWMYEQTRAAPKGSGVSCATCHMPTRWFEDADGADRIIATHNQNDNLRPNEKMIRSVCADCHGLRFTLDALADKALVQRNFAGASSVKVESIDWALRHTKQRETAK